MGPDMTKYRRLFPKARIPLPIVRKIATQLLLALEFLHDKCGVIHTGEYNHKHTLVGSLPNLLP
jgi:serine/threonine-protein kinase SRPK3